MKNLGKVTLVITMAICMAFMATACGKATESTRITNSVENKSTVSTETSIKNSSAASAKEVSNIDPAAITFTINNVEIKLNDPASKLTDCGLTLSNIESTSIEGKSAYQAVAKDSQGKRLEFYLDSSDTSKALIKGIYGCYYDDTQSQFAVPVTFSNGIQKGVTFDKIKAIYGDSKGGIGIATDNWRMYSYYSKDNTACLMVDAYPDTGKVYDVCLRCEFENAK